MPSAPEAEQHALLVAVLKRVNNNTIDFQAVADEMGLSKTAALKRWQRFVERTLKTSNKAVESKAKEKAGKKSTAASASASGSG